MLACNISHYSLIWLLTKINRFYRWSSCQKNAICMNMFYKGGKAYISLFNETPLPTLLPGIWHLLATYPTHVLVVMSQHILKKQMYDMIWFVAFFFNLGGSATSHELGNKCCSFLLTNEGKQNLGPVWLGPFWFFFILAFVDFTSGIRNFN